MHDREKKQHPSKAKSESKGRAHGISTNRSKSPGKDNKSACRFHLKGKCSKGKACAYWHLPQCRFFKNGNSFAGDKCQSVHKDATATLRRPQLVTRGGGGGANDDEEKPKRRGRSPIPKGSKSGAKGAPTVCLWSMGASDNAGIGETPAMASATGGASHLAKTNNKVRVMDVAMIQTFPFEGQSLKRCRYE